MIYAFTSIAANYIPKALVLAQTLKAHNPDVHMSILLAERPSNYTVERNPAVDEWFYATDLGIPDFEAWAFKHTIVELCTAIKGPYIAQLLQRPDCDGALYFDPDMVVLSSLDGLIAEFNRGSILLTPHQTQPADTPDTVRDNDLTSLRLGVYNLGFLGLRPTADGLAFAAWWRDRLLEYCYDEPERGIFTDQKWVDLAPAFFDDVRVMRKPQYNVATWNLAHRTVTGSFANQLLVDGEPIVFYHLSGFDSGAQLVMLYKYGRDMPGLFELRNWYIRQAARNGFGEISRIPWSFGRYHDGTPIDVDDRRRYRSSAQLQSAYPDPFAGISTR